MAHQVKALATKFDDVSQLLEPTEWKGKTDLHSCSLTSTAHPQ